MARCECLFIGSIGLGGFNGSANGGNAGAAAEQISQDVSLVVSILHGVKAVGEVSINMSEASVCIGLHASHVHYLFLIVSGRQGSLFVIAHGCCRL